MKDTKINNEKYNHIVKAAMQIFSKNGYKNTSIDEIILLANVSKGLIFHSFGNKKNYIYIYMTLLMVYYIGSFPPSMLYTAK